MLFVKYTKLVVYVIVDRFSVFFFMLMLGLVCWFLK